MEHWVKAGIVENRFEADRVSQALTDAQIPFLMKPFHDTAYDGLYILQKGWGAFLVPERFKEDAEKMIAEVRETFREEDGDATGQSG
jgi:hypothetical protein